MSQSHLSRPGNQSDSAYAILPQLVCLHTLIADLDNENPGKVLEISSKHLHIPFGVTRVLIYVFCVYANKGRDESVSHAGQIVKRQSCPRSAGEGKLSFVGHLPNKRKRAPLSHVQKRASPVPFGVTPGRVHPTRLWRGQVWGRQLRLALRQTVTRLVVAELQGNKPMPGAVSLFLVSQAS